MHALITRAAGDGCELGGALTAIGWTVSFAPLLRIEYADIGDEALEGASALAFTSRYAVAALRRSAALRRAVELPVFAVGPATARAAQEAGFQRIITGQGTAAELLSTILQSRERGAGPIVHVAGADLAFDLQGAATKAGLAVRTVVAYRSVAVETLPADIVAAAVQGTLDTVVLLSPRTAQSWVRTVNAVGNGDIILRKMRHVCLSPAVADAVTATARIENGPGTAEVLKFDVALRPNMEEILALMRRLVEHSPPR